MRDLGLARRQFLGGLFCLIAAAAIGYFFLLPQFHRNQALQLAQSTPDPKQLEYLSKQTPFISYNQPGSWEKNVINYLYSDSLAVKAIIFSIQGDYHSAKPAENLPSYIKKVPLRLVANGSFKALQDMVAKITERFPASMIRTVNFKSLNTGKLKAGESPVVEGEITLDLYVVCFP
jgi:hypothetical protein